MSPDDIAAENQKRRTLITKYKSKKTKLIKDPNAPKRPLSGYIRYFMETRDATITPTAAASQSSARWRSMSEAEKRVPHL
jgi:hypothetical protein